MVSAAKDLLTFDDLMATLIDFSKYVLNRLQIDHLTQEILVGPTYNQLKGTCTSSIELEYNMEECFKALTNRLDWNNSEGDRCPFDLTKPLPLKGCPGHLTVVAEYFFNNDMEFLKIFQSREKVHYVYHEDKSSSILGVKSASVNKLHGYGHMEEIMVKIADRQLYKFKEGDFVDPNLNDIEDMLLLVVQHKLFHLDNSNLVDFIMALRMFTRSLIIKRRVEDLQLGVESSWKYAAHTICAPVFLKTQEVRRTFPKYAALSTEISPAESDLKLKPKPQYASLSSWSSWTACARNTAGRTGRLLDGGGFAFSIMKSGIWSNGIFKFWPTCDPSVKDCNGEDKIYGLDERGVLKQYVNSKKDDTIRARRYNEWLAENNKHQDYGSTSIDPRKITNPDHQFNPILSIKSYFPDSSQVTHNQLRPRDCSFMEWLKIKIEHTNVSNTVKNVVLNEWILDSFEEDLDSSEISKDPYSRDLEEYKLVFDNEIAQLANEYGLSTSWTTYGKNVNKSIGKQHIHGMIKDMKKKNDGKVV
ncbi:hypothetical protein Tco_1343287 [Tanacetum coccineum]